MNNSTVYIILQFVVLVLLQVLVLNHINFLGYINPYLYILFILYYPIKNNRTTLLISSFLIGLCIDIFSDSGGVHAAASVALAYLRPTILKFSFGMVYEHQSIKFNNIDMGKRFVYISIFALMHHFILFSLEIFNISKIILTLQKTLFSSIFTILLCVITSILFRKNHR